MRAHSTQETKTKAMCLNKTRHEHAANEKLENNMTRKHAAENMSCVQQHKKTVKHAAELKLCATQNNTIHMDRRAHGPSKLENARFHNKTEHGA